MKIESTDKIVFKKIKEIKPYIRNPRKNDKTIDALTKIIPVVGFNQPILIDKNNVIVKGHARFIAAIRLGMEEVPCVVTDADEEAIKLDRLADNKISELTEWTENLETELEALNIDFDVTDIGFPQLADFEDDYFEEENEENIDKIGQEFPSADRYEQQEQENRDGTYTNPETASRESINPAEAAKIQAKLDKAYEEQNNIGQKPTKKYTKVTCEKCGHVMFIVEGEDTFEV